MALELPRTTTLAPSLTRLANQSTCTLEIRPVVGPCGARVASVRAVAEVSGQSGRQRLAERGADDRAAVEACDLAAIDREIERLPDFRAVEMG